MSGARPDRTIAVWRSAVKGFCVCNDCQEEGGAGGGEMGGCSGGGEVYHGLARFPAISGMPPVLTLLTRPLLICLNSHF